MSLSPMQEAAVNYIRQGFAVLPCLSVRMMGSDEQIARFRDSSGLMDKLAWRVACKISKASIPPYTHQFIRDEVEAVAVFGRYPLANIQIATGEPSGVAVLDVDFYRKAHKALGGITLPETLKVRTGRGEHWYFRWPQEIAFTRRQYRKNFILGDVCRAVMPPSVHFNGKVYTWETEAEMVPLPEAFARASGTWVSDRRTYTTYRNLKHGIFVYVLLPLVQFYVRLRFR